MSCDWKGNRRSGVALAMRHRLNWFIHLRAQGLSKGEEHPTNMVLLLGQLSLASFGVAKTSTSFGWG